MPNLSEDNSKNLDKDEIRRAISKLSYEEALNSLELILNQLKKDDVRVDDLKRYYLQGKIYLEHCEKMLKIADQEIIEFSKDEFSE